MAQRKNLPTYHALVIIGLLLSHKRGRAYGQEITKATKITSGTLYPLLQQLERAGIILKETENGDARRLRRPTRKYYSLTDKGRRYGEKYKAKVLASNPPLVPFEAFI